VALTTTAQDLLQAWFGLAEGDSNVVFVLELEPYNLVTETTDTLYYASGMYRRAPSLSASRFVLPSFRISIIEQGAQVFSPRGIVTTEMFRSSPYTLGRFQVVNPDGLEDNLVKFGLYSWTGRDFRVKVGDRSWAYGSFEVLAPLQGIIRGEPTFDLNTISFEPIASIFDPFLPLQTDFYKGTGSLEGSEELAGKPKPIWLGRKRGVKAPLLDSINLVYHLHGGAEAMASVDAVYEGGKLLTVTTDYTVDLTAGINTVELLAEPSFDITFDCTGPASVGNKPGAIVDHLLQTYGGVASGSIDASAITAYDAEFNYDCGFWRSPDDTDTLGGAIEEMLRPRGFWVPTDDGTKITFSWIKNPRTETASQTYTTRQIRNIARKGSRQPSYLRRVGYQHIPDPITSAVGVIEGTATLARQSTAWRFVEVSSAGILTQHPSALAVESLSPFYARLNALAEANEQLAIFSQPWRLFDVDIATKPFFSWIGDYVAIDYPRFGLQDGGELRDTEELDARITEASDPRIVEGNGTTLALVAGVSVDLNSRRIALECWG